MDPIVLTEMFDPATLPPGTYEASSDTVAYPLLRYLMIAGFAKPIWQQALPAGRLRIIAQVQAPRRNPIEEPVGPAGGAGRMQITRKWAEENVLQDYVDWKEAWWREAIQNSVDAGATQIALTTTEEPDGSWLIACDDDGSGMTYEQIEDKENGFLGGLGGSWKRGGLSTTGAFGKAKELLVLPWIKYQVLNRDRRYIGSADNWQWWPAPMRKGVRVEAVMPADWRTTDTIAKGLLDKCWIPNVTFTINGHRYTTKLRVPTDPEDLVREHPMAMIYKIRRERSPEVYVRKNGIWMFSIPFEGKAIGESLLVEVTADSKTAFKQNRDHFARHSLADTITSLTAKMTKEKILPRRDLMEFRDDYPSLGPDVMAARATRIQLTLGTLPEVGKDGARFDKKSLEAMRLILAEYQEQDHQNGLFLGLADPDSAVEIMSNMRIMGQTSYDNVCKQLVWSQHFAIHRFPGWPTIPKRFEPPHMSPAAYRLARVWGELVRYVMMMLDTSREVNVGWVFSKKEARALSANEKGRQYVMINPFKDLNGGNDGEAFDPNDPRDLRKLYALVIHELTHAVDGVGEHDESYSSAITDNIEKAPLGMCDLRALLKSVKTRLPEELRPPKPVGPKPPPGPNKQDMMAHLALRVLRSKMDAMQWEEDKAAKALAFVLARLDMKPRPPGWEYDSELQKRGAMMRAAAKQLKDNGRLILDKGALMYGGEYWRRSLAELRTYLLVSDGSKALRRWEAIEAAAAPSMQASDKGELRWEADPSFYDRSDLRPLAGQLFDPSWDADTDPLAAKMYDGAASLRHTLNMLDGPFYRIRRAAGSSPSERLAAYLEMIPALGREARELIGYLSLVDPFDVGFPDLHAAQLIETGEVKTSTMRFKRFYDPGDSKDHYSLITTSNTSKIIWDLTIRLSESYGPRDYTMDTGRMVAEPIWTWPTDPYIPGIERVSDIIVAVETLTQARKQYEQAGTDSKAEIAEQQRTSVISSLLSLSETLFPSSTGLDQVYASPELASMAATAMIEYGVTDLPSGHELAVLPEDYRTFMVTLYVEDPATRKLWERAGEAYAYGAMRRPYSGANAKFYSITASTVIAGNEP